MDNPEHVMHGKWFQFLKKIGVQYNYFEYLHWGLGLDILNLKIELHRLYINLLPGWIEHQKYNYKYAILNMIIILYLLIIDYINKKIYKESKV